MCVEERDQFVAPRTIERCGRNPAVTARVGAVFLLPALVTDAHRDPGDSVPGRPSEDSWVKNGIDIAWPEAAGGVWA